MAVEHARSSVSNASLTLLRTPSRFPQVTVISHRDGRVETRRPQGHVTVGTPDGHWTHKYPDGTRVQHTPAGGRWEVTADGSTSQRLADGTVATTNTASGARVVTRPDGVVVETELDGTTTTRQADGTAVVMDPEVDEQTVTMRILMRETRQTRAPRPARFRLWECARQRIVTAPRGLCGVGCAEWAVRNGVG